MSDRKNYYHGQLVMEDELDAGFEYAEQGELALANDASLFTAGTADTPDCQVFGGIVNGLTVTYVAGNDYVTVAPGVCRDALGRRIELTSAATVKITSAGSTDEGDLVDALGDGAVITTSCPATNYIIASLFLVYDENLSDSALDDTGATVYFTVQESFHFDILIGANFTDPTGATPTRGALHDSRVLITDLVLYHDGGTGTMEVASINGIDAIVDSDTQWDALAAAPSTFPHLANLDGRRADYLAMDEGSDFPRNAEVGVSIRGNSPRSVIHTLVKHLQRQTSAAENPAGAELIGAQAQTGAGTTYGTATVPLTPLEDSLTAGSLDSQLLSLLDAVNRRADRGDDIIAPSAFRLYSPSNLADNSSYLRGELATIGGSVGDLQHIVGPHGFYFHAPMVHDHFVYPTWAQQTQWIEEIGLGSGGSVAVSSVGAWGYNTERGTILLGSGSGAGPNYARIHSASIFNLDHPSSAYLIARFRIMDNAALVNAIARIGFKDYSANALAYLQVDAKTPIAGDKAFLHVQDSTAVETARAPIAGTDLFTPMPDGWYTMALWCDTASNNAMSIYVNGGTTEVATLPTLTLGSGPFFIFCEAYTVNGSATETVVELDFMTGVGTPVKYID